MQKTALPLEVKAVEGREFVGHGSVFRNVDLGDDIVVPGAFKSTLKAHKEAGTLPAMFWMHDPSRVAGKWTDMYEDDYGLVVKGVLADTDLGNEIRTLLKMEAVRGLSIGYITKNYDYDKAGNRLIKEADLFEVSVVSLPMNPMAQVTHVKSRLSATGEYVPTPREFERILRDVGCSKAVAKRMIHKLFDDEDEAGAMPVVAQCDAEVEEAEEVAKRIADQILAEAIKATFKK